jgi:formylglycine-generating enzyme required for sulfatase activity
MKTQKSLIRLAIVLIAIIGFSATNIPENKDYVKFDDKLYALRHEVTNREYREFLQDLKATNQNEKYAKCLYDSSLWISKIKYSYCEPLKMAYHYHPAYDNYPTVNISLEGAKSYGEWLTDKYNKDAKRKYKKVLFRLPSENEWKKLASPLSGHNLPWEGSSNSSKNGKTHFSNIKVMDPKTAKVNYIGDGGLGTIIVAHYKPNNLGIYDVIGNVSEMTQEGTQKGGSWDNYLEESTIDKTQNYTLPDPRVGFRIVMEIIEE